MTRHNVLLNWFGLGIVLLAFALTLSTAFAAGTVFAKADDREELRGDVWKNFFELGVSLGHGRDCVRI